MYHSQGHSAAGDIENLVNTYRARLLLKAAVQKHLELKYVLSEAMVCTSQFCVVKGTEHAVAIAYNCY